MIPSAEELSKKLAPLVGQPWWRETRSLNLHVFHFGEKVAKPVRKGGTVDVGSLSLHLQCAWRILSEGTVLIGSRDRMRPRGNPDDVPDDFTWNVPRSTLCDEKMEALLALHAAEPLRVVSIHPGTAGAFQVMLSKGYTLEVFPDDSEDEQWRFFDRNTDEHFVCTLEDDDEGKDEAR